MSSTANRFGQGSSKSGSGVSFNITQLDSRYLNDDGDVMSGNLDMTGHLIQNLKAPIHQKDCVNLEYLNLQLNEVRNENKNKEISKNIDLKYNYNIIKSKSPENYRDFVHKEYADKQHLSETFDLVDVKLEDITPSSTYSGNPLSNLFQGGKYWSTPSVTKAYLELSKPNSRLVEIRISMVLEGSYHLKPNKILVQKYQEGNWIDIFDASSHTYHNGVEATFALPTEKALNLSYTFAEKYRLFIQHNKPIWFALYSLEGKWETYNDKYKVLDKKIASYQNDTPSKNDDLINKKYVDDKYDILDTNIGEVKTNVNTKIQNINNKLFKYLEFSKKSYKEIEWTLNDAVQVSSMFNSTHSKDKMFDNNDSTYWYSSAASINTDYIKIVFPSPVNLRRIKFKVKYSPDFILFNRSIEDHNPPNTTLFYKKNCFLFGW